MTRGTTLAIWVSCLAGGVGLGVLTDGGTGPTPLQDGVDERIDRSGMRPPNPVAATEDDADDQAGSARRAGGSSSPEADGVASGSDLSAAADAGPRPGARPRPGGPRLGAADPSILDGVLPDVTLLPPGGLEPDESTTTTEPPSSTTTTSEPPTSTTETTTGSGGTGSDPLVTPLPDVRNP